MTSHYRLENIDIDYADQISLEVENEAVDFIYQYPYSAFDIGSTCDWNVERICGKPTKFPNYGNFSEIFTMKTYGPEISISPWQDEVHGCFRWIKNYIDISFLEPVYPIRISIYEVCNPGNLIEIWAQNYENKKWFLLWNGSRQIVPLTSRVFSPSLQTCNFKTKCFRLKFKHNIFMNDHIKIDAVMLIGSSKLILSENSKHSLTDLLKRINCIHTDLYHKNNRDIKKTINQSNLKDNKVSRKKITNYKRRDIHYKQGYSNCLVLKNCLNFNCKNLQLTANKSQELSHYSLSSFPTEIILKILKNLDLLTLCRISQVDRRFNELTQEHLRYTSLNMRYMRKRNISDIKISNIFCYFTPRCEYLKQLDLTGSSLSSDFVQFLENCGSHLTHLRLAYCLEINDLMLFNISTICKNLKVLDLTDVKCGFSYLKNLENVEYLNLSTMNIYNENDIEDLCEMLQRNQRMRELNLTRSHIRELNAIIKELRNSCQNLEIINLSGIDNISSENINDLSDCKNLRKLNLKVNEEITDDSLCKLFFSCQRLEEIHLFDFNIQKKLKLLTCKNLIKLYLHKYHYNFSLASDNFFILNVILEQCPKLQELHTDNFIRGILTDQWKLMYPNLSVYTIWEFTCI